MITVALILGVLAAMALMLSMRGAMDSALVSRQTENEMAGYIAESGLAHAQWQLANSMECAGYTDIPATAFAAGTYSASLTPDNGSPVSVNVLGMLPGGASRSLLREEISVFDVAQPMVYTIVIDSDGMDTFIEGESGHTDHNKDNDNELKTSSETGKEYRTLMRFDLSVIPTHVQVQSATIELYLQSFGSTDVVTAHRVLRDWTEADVTWLNYDSASTWATAGGDFDAEIAGTFLADRDGPVAMDITELAQGWVTRSQSNYGVILMSEPSASGSENKYHSGDKPDEPHPRLTITYACECGKACIGMTAGHTLLLATDNSASLGELDFDSSDIAEFDPIDQTASLFLGGGMVGLNEKIDAIHVTSSDYIVLSTNANASLGGVSFDKSDLVRYDPATDTATLLFDGSTHFAGAGEDIVAVHVLSNDNLVLSTIDSATLGGVSFSARDLVEYNPVTSGASIYFDGDATTLSEDIMAVHLLENENIVLSAADDTSLGGRSFTESDLIEYDPISDIATLYFPGNELFSDDNEKVRAVHILGDSGPDVGVSCSADYTPTLKTGEFSTAAYGSYNIKGLTFYPEGSSFNGIVAPAGGAWISIDNNTDAVTMTDMSGSLLASAAIPFLEPTGIVYVEAGDNSGLFATTDYYFNGVYWLDNSGSVVSSFANATFANPVGVAYIGETAGGSFDQSLAIMSNVAWNDWRVYIVAQDGSIQRTLDVSAYVANPEDVTHLPGTDKLLIVDRDSLDVITVDFDGNELSRYALTGFGVLRPNDVAIHPLSCEHVIADLDGDLVMSLGAGGGGGGGGGGETYRDEFNVKDYSGDDGSLAWSTDWLEIGESDGATKGDEQVRSDGAQNFVLRVRDNDNGGEGVQREADLSACSAASLAFDYRREGFDDANDYVTVDVSANGGSSWTEMGRLSGPADESSYGAASYDIGAAIAADTRIRFLTSSSLGGSDNLFVDNVEIVCAE